MNTIKAKKALPSTLHETIVLACEDLKKVFEMPETYEVYLNTYHTPGYLRDERCVVCFAGAVMAMTLLPKKYKDIKVMPADFNSVQTRKLRALDALRTSSVRGALHHFYDDENLDLTFNLDGCPRITGYWGTAFNDLKTRKQFFAEMTKLANWLKKKGW